MSRAFFKVGCGKPLSMKSWPGLVDSKKKGTSYSVYKKGSAALVSALRLTVDEKNSQHNESF